MEKKLSEKIKINLITGFFASYILPLNASLRWKRIRKSDYDGPVIYALWHGNQFANLSVTQKERYKHNLLISPSNDGETIANVSHLLGYGLIRGSVGRRGAEAAREIISKLDAGENISYTVDGPKGPIYKVKPGIIRLAQMAKVPIIPLQAAMKSGIFLPSWDNYHLPSHFAKCVAIHGEPIFIPEELSKEETKQFQEKIETELKNLYDECKEALK